ncbi:MAG: chromate transporter [Oscillospiraceae bacterium]|nr:chromate transporter [Oscillospiraceae bacterium]
MIYINLFIEFFKTGLFAIGGGLATLPFLHEIADKYDWFTQSELIDMVAVSESTPGPLGVNMAAYAGFNAAGVWGSIVAVTALVSPSMIIILIISRFLKRFGESRIVSGTFKVLRPAAAGLILAAALSIITLTVFNTETRRILPIPLILYAILTTLCFLGEQLHKLPKLRKLRPHPVLFIAVGAVLGIALL